MPEGFILFLLGLLGLVDTITPQRIDQARAYGDFIGTLLYVGFLSAVLAIGGGILCFQNRADLGKLMPALKGNLRLSSIRKVTVNLSASKSALAFLAVGLYILMTPYLGYVLSTFLFFLVIFGWQGYRWSLRNLVLSLIMAVAFSAFAHVADIPVPMGLALF